RVTWPVPPQGRRRRPSIPPSIFYPVPSQAISQPACWHPIIWIWIAGCRCCHQVRASRFLSLRPTSTPVSHFTSHFHVQQSLKRFVALTLQPPSQARHHRTPLFTRAAIPTPALFALFCLGKWSYTMTTPNSNPAMDGHPSPRPGPTHPVPPGPFYHPLPTFIDSQMSVLSPAPGSNPMARTSHHAFHPASENTLYQGPWQAPTPFRHDPGPNNAGQPMGYSPLPFHPHPGIALPPSPPSVDGNTRPPGRATSRAPPKERQGRDKKACDRCNLKKVRCSQQKPACKECMLRPGPKCEYSVTSRRNPKAAVHPGRKPTPRQRGMETYPDPFSNQGTGLAMRQPAMPFNGMAGYTPPASETSGMSRSHSLTGRFDGDTTNGTGTLEEHFSGMAASNMLPYDIEPQAMLRTSSYPDSTHHVLVAAPMAPPQPEFCICAAQKLGRMQALDQAELPTQLDPLSDVIHTLRDCVRFCTNPCWYCSTHPGCIERPRMLRSVLLHVMSLYKRVGQLHRSASQGGPPNMSTSKGWYVRRVTPSGLSWQLNTGLIQDDVVHLNKLINQARELSANLGESKETINEFLAMSLSVSDIYWDNVPWDVPLEASTLDAFSFGPSLLDGPSLGPSLLDDPPLGASLLDGPPLGASLLDDPPLGASILSAPPFGPPGFGSVADEASDGLSGNHAHHEFSYFIIEDAGI
ncbi:hypothetical protein QBC39DRAFT_111264, partial [Podospora conica]